MDTFCNIPMEDLPFTFLGLCLQEPMTLITNLLMSITSFTLYFQLKTVENDFQKFWKLFYLSFGVSTFFGGFGHLFFQYTGVYGKFPSWVFAFLSAFFAGKAMISLGLTSRKLYQFANGFLYLKLFALTGLAIYSQWFMFVTFDAIITYLLYCMSLGIFYWAKGLKSFVYTVIAVGILIPSVFIFTLEYSPNIWFNKNDLSHVIITITIILFYFGVTRFNQIELENLISARKVKYDKK